MSLSRNTFWLYTMGRIGVLKQSVFIFFIGIACFITCKPDNEKVSMEQEKKQIIEMCLKFTKRADALEKRAFDNGEYRLKQFVPDFNRLFDQYAYGANNRTLSGLNFGNPPRYFAIVTSVNTAIESLSKTEYRVTFEGAQKSQSIRFLISKVQSEWRLIHFETYVGVANHGENMEEEIWRKHKL